MFAAIKLFFAGFKTYFYGAIVVIICASAIWAVEHERHVGEAKVEARDVIINTQRTAIAAAATQHTKDVQALAQALSDQIGDTFEKAVAAPVTAPLHVLCYRPTAAPAGGDLPKTAGNKSGAVSPPDQRTETPVDIGPPVVTVGKDSDAQINALIDEIKVLTDAMNGKTK